MKRAFLCVGFSAALFAILSLFNVSVANAAAIYFSPSSGNVTVGNIVTTSVFVNTQGQGINNADAVINFPAHLLEVVSISKSGSIFSLWVEEPAFSNSAGTISFNGGLPTPGFNGASGKIVGVVFRAKSSGSASVIFSSAAVRANDGFGTDILQTQTQAQFNLVAPVQEEQPPPPPVTSSGVPAAPVVRSSTHPDQDKWYVSNNAAFSWDVPSDVNAARLLVGENPSSIPTILYEPPITSRDISSLNLEDGVWYLHVQLRNAQGWGAVTHYKFQIDSAKPTSFAISEAEREDATEPRVSFVLSSSDQVSGISHYELQIDERAMEIVQTGQYTTPVLSPGTHTLIAKALDKAGNYLLDSIEFSIEAIAQPVLVEYPVTVKTNTPFLVTGTTYPDGMVTVSLQKGKETISAVGQADGRGNFSVNVEQGLREAGRWQLSVAVTDTRGAQSLPTERVFIQADRSAFFEVGSQLTTVLSVLVPIIALVLLLVGVVWYGFIRFNRWRRKIRKEVRDVERALHKAMDLLKEDIAEQVKMLERAKSRRKLTAEEDKIIERLKQDLDDVEEVVGKEIRDIRREIK